MPLAACTLRNGVFMRFDHFSHLLTYQAERFPNAPALRYEDQMLTYSELLDKVRSRSAQIREDAGTCLGILADGSLSCVVEIFAGCLAGLQLVMLDQNQPEEVLASLIQYTDTDRLWGERELKDVLSASLTAGTDSGAGKILFFTSGTTRQAKAVVLTEHSLCQSAFNGSRMLPLAPSDTLLCLLPLNHVFGFVCGLLWGLSCGACVCLGRGPRHYMQDFSFYRPTAVSVVPALLGFLLQTRAINPELKLVLVGAGDCPAALLAQAADLGLRVSFGYGLTETSSGVAISTGGDPFAMDICPDDEVTVAKDGEILLRAPTCMMQGYYKCPEDTAAILADGVLHTGDLGFLDADGRLHITGRKKDILVLPDGTKLFLPEYEAKISALLGHSELAVILDQGRPILIYSCQDDADVHALFRRLAPLMAMLPRSLQLSSIRIISEPLPRTATGKIKRWELRQKVGLL